MKTMRSNSPARSLVCVIDAPIVEIILRRPLNERASLKARSSRSARRLERFMPPDEPESPIPTSATEITTTS
eukprot:199628-Prymnesium_polylepis.1